MKTYKAKTFSEAYRLSLNDILLAPEYVTKPRDMEVRENMNVGLVIENPLSCLYQNEIRSSQKKYIAAELLWYFMGEKDVYFIRKYAKFWDTIKNDDDTVNSAYGNLIFNKINEHGYSQYQWAILALQKDQDSRQAVLHFNLPEHQYRSNRDFVCTMYAIFHIRDNRLNLTVSMRSNDAIWGLPTDAAFFAILQSQAVHHLRKTYPELEMGSYTHFANSLHIYDRHFDLVERMIREPFIPEEIPPVQQDLVNTSGESTKALIDLFLSQEKQKPLPQSDPLFNWIQKNID